MEFSEAIELSPRDVLIVDAMNVAFRWKHSNATEFVDQYVNTVYSLANSYKCGTIIIVSDNRGSSYRKEIYPEYKANRNFEDQTEEEKLAFEAFIEEYENCLEAFRVRELVVLNKRGVEADDFAAYICKERQNLGIDNIWLISSDKDWDLLIDENVSRFSTVTRKEVRLSNFEDTYGVTPEEYISLKVLQGDSGDNIMGIPQVGPKRAVSLIKEYGSAFDIYEGIPIPGKYKYIQNVNNSEDLIPLNYELMDLISWCENAIGKEYCGEIDKLVQGVLK